MVTLTFREEEEDDPVPRSSNLGVLMIVQHCVSIDCRIVKRKRQR